MEEIEIIDIKIPENNKFPVGRLIAFLILILLIIGFFVYDIFFNKEVIERTFSFKDESIIMNFNSVYDIDDLLNLTNLNVNDMEFTINNSLIYIDNYQLISKNTVGEVILTATYKDITDTIKIIIDDGIDKSIKLVFLKNSIDLNKNSRKNIHDYLKIQNINREDIVFSSSDTEVVNIVDGNIITSDVEGSSVVTAKYNDLETNIEIVVGNKYLYFNEEEVILDKNSKYEINDYLDVFGVNTNNIVYKVNDLSILYLESGEIFTRSKEGKAVIIATYGDLEAKLNIIVE